MISCGRPATRTFHHQTIRCEYAVKFWIWLSQATSKRRRYLMMCSRFKFYSYCRWTVPAVTHAELFYMYVWMLPPLDIYTTRLLFLNCWCYLAVGCARGHWISATFSTSFIHIFTMNWPCCACVCFEYRRHQRDHHHDDVRRPWNAVLLVTDDVCMNVRQ